MPSLFRKSTSDTFTLSETNRKVLHKCRMLLIKDLEVTDILESMSHDDLFKCDARDSILNLPTREQRVASFLDRLETKGDRAFSVFVESLRDQYKHLHYALEEALRTVDDKKDSVREYRLSISGGTVRRHLRNNMRRKIEQLSHGGESVDDMDVVFDDRSETYVDCYAIPMRGRLNKEKWLKSTPEPKHEVLAREEEEEGDEEDTYMGMVLKDLLFKKIDSSEIPDGVKKPPNYSSVYVLDKDNKYGLIRKQPKDRYGCDSRQSEFRGVTSNMTSHGLDMDVTLDQNDWANEQLPNYTAPPPPTLPPSSPSHERRRNDSGDGPPPPLPPKPGNLPPLNTQLKPKPPEPPITNEVAIENGEVVKPPPRSTSLTPKFDDKPLPLPVRKTSKSKMGKLQKERHASGSSFTGEKSPPSTQSTPASSPPIPPRKYYALGSTSEDLTGSGALSLIQPNAPPPLPDVPPPMDEPTNDIAFSLPHASVDLEQENDIESSSQVTLKEVTEEGDFDPYSLHADHAFQVRGGVKASGDVASEADTATGSSNATLTQEELEQTISAQDEEQYEAVATRPQATMVASQLAAWQPEEAAADDGLDTVVVVGGEATMNGVLHDATYRDSSPLDSDDMQHDTSRDMSLPGDMQHDTSRDMSLPEDMQHDTSRDMSLPGDMQHDTSRDMSLLEDSFKASADSLDSATTPGSGEIRSDATTDSGIGGAQALDYPPMLKQRHGSKSNTHAQYKTAPQKDISRHTPELSEVQVLADGDSSDANSYYEDIDTFDDRSNPMIPLLEPSERTSVSYLDPKTYFKAIEKMAQKGLCKEGTLKRIAIVEEWEASGRALLGREELVVAETVEAYTVPKSADQSSHPVPSTSVTSQAKGGGGSMSGVDSSGAESDSTLPPATPCLPHKDPYDPYRFTTIVFDKLGRAFYVPSKHVRKHGDPDGEPWYYPIEISSHQATLFLGAEKQEGCFLVYRPKSKRSKALYNLSICRGSGDVVHYHIIENSHGDVMLQGHDHTFLNVVELVRYFQRNKSQLATKLRRPLKEATLPITPGYHYELQWEVSRSHLNLTGRILGKGNYGVVCAGLYHKHIPVAVKVLQNPDASVQEEDDFIEEARCLMGLNHEHVVRFVGLSCTAKPFFLVTEYLPKGNLQSCLRNNIVPADNIEQLFDVCIQVTSAMEYLESRRFVLHRDLAARNFLVADDLCVKLADFGRAIYVMDDYYQAPRDEKIPIKWASPEVLVDSHYSTKSDIWALGVVFWEILSGGERPYEHFSGEQTAVYVTEGGRLEKPVGCPMDLYTTMKRCWCACQHDRPSFASLLEKLKSKSSIYYSSSPLNQRNSSNNSNSKSGANRRSSVSNNSASSKSVTSSSFGFSGSSRSERSSPARKKNHAFMIDTRSQESGGRRLHLPISELRDRPSRASLNERMGTSGSETSLTSAMDRDDLSRGGKIRKSIRKMISMRSKKKPPGLEGLKEDRVDKAQNMYGSEF